MKVAIAGAHGKVARELARQLIARGDSVVGLIRNPAHAPDIEADGGTPVECDLEHAEVAAVANAIRGCDAAVFAAGAGAGSGAERKLTMDRDGAVKLLYAARAAGVKRFVIVSSYGAQSPPDDDAVFSVYLRAKAAADAAVVESDRDWTIVRPGGLTDDPGTGTIRIDTAPYRGSVSRTDVAAVLAAVLHDPEAIHATLYVNGGDAPISEALAAALA